MRACYWIIGRDNAGQRPAVAIDVHHTNGDLAQGTFTAQLEHVSQAEDVAAAYARTMGITELTHDTDSTDCFARD